MKESGIIEWFNESKGYGVIDTPTKGKYFLHKSNLLSTPTTLLPQTPVIFKPDFEKNRKTAKECHLPEDVEDFCSILTLLGQSQTVSFKTKTKGTTRRGTPYFVNELISFNILEISIKFLFNNKSKDEIFNLVQETFIELTNTRDEFDYNNFFQVITKHINQLPFENIPQLTEKLYQFFGNNLTEKVLFSVWWKKSFHFIGKTDYEYYIIPENILLQNAESLTTTELNRIKEYENGETICSNIVSIKIKKTESLTHSDEIIKSFAYLEFVKNDKQKKKLRSFLNNLLYENTLVKINGRFTKLSQITDKKKLKYCCRLEESIPTELDENQKSKLSKIISETIISNSTEQVKIDLWLLGYITEIENSEIIELLCDENIQLSNKFKALSKTYKSDNITLILEQLIDRLSPIKTFELIEQFVAKENDLGYYFKLKSANENDFNTNKIGFNLFEQCKTLASKTTTEEEQTNLFFLGWLNNYPKKYIINIAQNLSSEELQKILKCKNTSDEFKCDIFNAKCKNITFRDADWFLKLGKEFLPIDDFEKIDNQIIERISNENWFVLWENQTTKVLLEKYLIEYFNDDQSRYNRISNWIDKDIISKEKIHEILNGKLESIKTITDRTEFYTAYYIIEILLKIEPKWADKILSLKSDFYNLLLWHLGNNREFDFEILKRKFIYFKPEDQVYIFKRLFYLKHKQQIDFDLEKLDEILRADVDLYLTNEKFNNNFLLDISTHIIIECLKSYVKTGNFMFESDLILKDLRKNSNRKFRIEHYFDKCKGRLTPYYNWKMEDGRNISQVRKISQVFYGNGQYYYAIKFEPEKRVEGNNYYDTRTYFEKNPDFDYLKEEVKKNTKWKMESKRKSLGSSFN